ncbi:putative taste receptor type 2 member 33 [Dendropsophus ebraccatus]|uniref:putative taste receptor type 2 member 33 n=1 Tax=Dendropsophus ebraccatus TaxID=150705 RepID=UPI0038312EFB
MDTDKLITLIVPVTIEFVLGTALNLYILLFYIGNLKNGISLGPSDKVHLTKALVNVSLHMVVTIQCIMGVFWPFLYFRNGVFLLSSTINMFLNFYNYWLTAVLCVYYCTNITTGGHYVFVWLRRNLSSHLLHMLLVSGLGLVALCIPLLSFCSIDPPENTTYQSGVTQGVSLQNLPYKAISTVLGCFLPFTIALVCTTFTSWFLIKHMWRMRETKQGFTGATLKAQIKATRTMILFLLISVIYNVIQILFLSIISGTTDVVMVMTLLVILSYPMLEAIVIIQSSAKLWSALLETFFQRKRRNGEAET